MYVLVFFFNLDSRLANCLGKKLSFCLSVYSVLIVVPLLLFSLWCLGRKVLGNCIDQDCMYVLVFFFNLDSRLANCLGKKLSFCRSVYSVLIVVPLLLFSLWCLGRKVLGNCIDS